MGGQKIQAAETETDPETGLGPITQVIDYICNRLHFLCNRNRNHQFSRKSNRNRNRNRTFLLARNRL